MDRFLNRSSSTALGALGDTWITPKQPELNTGTLFDITPTPTSGASLPPLSVDVLDVKLQSLLQAITHNIAQEVGKNLAKELRGEIGQLEERTDSLEYKFNEMVQYVQVLEEDNATIKNTVTQLQAQQEDLENRTQAKPEIQRYS